MTFVQIVRIPVDGVSAFQAYESLVLPLLPAHGGRLERRLRSEDGRFELHVISFPSQEALDRYRADPVRVANLPLLEASGAATELVEVMDVAQM